MKKYAINYKKFTATIEANTPEEAIKLAPGASWTFLGWFHKEEAQAEEIVCCNACSELAGAPVEHTAPACPTDREYIPQTPAGGPCIYAPCEHCADKHMCKHHQAMLKVLGS